MSAPDYTLHVGDCLDSLRAMPDQSVHCCVTSPPYYGLRDYGVDGQIGLEETPEQFIAKLVEVFREVRRVLRDDGTLWINIGDSYAGSWGSQGRDCSGVGVSAISARQVAASQRKASQTGKIRQEGLKPKDLIGIPWMLAFALRADGWYLRQDIIWSKPNPMPESVRDRCTKAHEYVFLLSKSGRYYYDHEAIKEPATYGPTPTGVGFGHGTDKDARQRERVSNRNSFARKTKTSDGEHGQKPQHREGRPDIHYDQVRNKRSVWTITTRGYKGAHFATFPPALIEPCIKAGCPVGGVVLDPFGGSGTTAGVAIAHGRRAVLCELNAEYAELVPGRVDSILSSYGKNTKPKKPKPVLEQAAKCSKTIDLFAA